MIDGERTSGDDDIADVGVDAARDRQVVGLFIARAVLEVIPVGVEDVLVCLDDSAADGDLFVGE